MVPLEINVDCLSINKLFLLKEFHIFDVAPVAKQLGSVCMSLIPSVYPYECLSVRMSINLFTICTN